MKTRVKIAIIGAIAAVLAAVIPVVIPRVINRNGDPEKPTVTPPSEYHQTGNISVEDSKNVIIGNITTGGDAIIDGTKTTNTQVLSESQNSEAKQKNER